MKTNPYENHRNRHMSAQDIQNEIELLRRTAARRGPLNRRRVTADQWVGYGLLAIALVVPAIAAAIALSI